MENNKTTEEIQFYRKMLLETSDISKNWQKTLKIIITMFSTILIVGFIVCGLVCKMYFGYAYDSENTEKQNTTTNINKNINDNENK